MPLRLEIGADRYELTAEVTVIGRRAATCDVVLPPDGNASSEHAYLVALADGRWLLIDAKSTNGTYVNGRRRMDAVLRDGDHLQFGETVARVALGGPAGRRDAGAAPPREDPDSGRMRAGTAAQTPGEARGLPWAEGDPFARLRGLQNACFELLETPGDAGERAGRLAELSASLTGAARVWVVVPAPGSRGGPGDRPWRALAARALFPGPDTLPDWCAAGAWDDGGGRPLLAETIEARVRAARGGDRPREVRQGTAVLTALGGPRVGQALISPAARAGHGVLFGVLEAERLYAAAPFGAEDSRVLAHLARAFVAGLRRAQGDRSR